MKFRLALLIPALVALIAGLLAASPAEAATFGSQLKSKSIAISSAGGGKVAISCKTKNTCRGKLTFAGASTSRGYSVKGKTTKYVTVAMNRGASANPNKGGALVNGQYYRKSAVLKVAQTSPTRKTRNYRVTTETVVRSQQIRGTVNGPGGTGNVARVRVELITIDRGGNTHVARFKNDIPNGGSYSFNVGLGANNSASDTYYLRIVGPDAGNDAQSWFWRGSDARPKTGGRYLRDATAVRAVKTGDYNADFRYTSIYGSAPSGTRLTVAAAPPTYKGGAKARRELDIPGCANVYATVTASGSNTYRVNFLPYGGGDKRYMVAARRGNDERWNNVYGSCLDVQNYRYSRANMLAVPPSGLNHPVSVGASRNRVSVNGIFKGFKPTAQGDRWVTLREAAPGVAILDSPIIAERAANSAGDTTFSDVAPGRYYVELGRRTGCADWAPSRYTNNNSYFNGLDRGSERWKTFSILSRLPGSKTKGLERIARTVQPNPATDKEQGKRPRGAAGWMYRTHCKALGGGGYKVVDINGTGQSKRVSVASRKGGVVKGHVSRAVGRTNKEMMVTLSSTDGRRVLRTDLTDGKGNFYVAGLAPGRYKITVNADSWRGIGRGFNGTHFITVKAGRTRNAGNLKFKD